MRVFVLCLGTLASALAAPAAAQIAPGQSGTSSMSYLSSKEAWSVLSDYGKCYALTSRKDALSLVATQAGTAEEAKTYKRLFEKPYQSCLGNVTELNFSYYLVRGAIAEGLYWKRVPVPANLAVARIPDRTQVHSLSEAAICYAGNHRDVAKELVEQTKPGSEKESKAVSALWQDFGQCIPPTAARSLQIEATLLRFRIAEALWRLGEVPTASADAK